MFLGPDSPTGWGSYDNHDQCLETLCDMPQNQPYQRDAFTLYLPTDPEFQNYFIPQIRLFSDYVLYI